jgi:hypothetical protein
MKKRFPTIIRVLMLVAGCFAVLVVVSYRRALHVEKDVLKPCLSTSMNYKRAVSFGAFNPFGSMLPHWTITYYETPTDIRYDTPSITVNLFGQVSDWRSKEVAMMLFTKGYRDQY